VLEVDVKIFLGGELFEGKVTNFCKISAREVRAELCTTVLAHFLLLFGVCSVRYTKLTSDRIDLIGVDGKANVNEWC
jgi:hypothetical protein